MKFFIIILASFFSFNTFALSSIDCVGVSGLQRFTLNLKEVTSVEYLATLDVNTSTIAKVDTKKGKVKYSPTEDLFTSLATSTDQPIFSMLLVSLNNPKKFSTRMATVTVEGSKTVDMFCEQTL